MKDYSKYLIKDYNYWLVNIAKFQSYLGRCVIYCKRKDAVELGDATKEEQEELFLVINEMKATLQKAFQPDWYNYSFLGNETRHLHGHLVPRYEEKREFNSTTFRDEMWGHHYVTDRNFMISDEILMAIKERIKENLK